MSVKVKNADGTWSQVGGMKKPAFADILGNPNDNTNLKNALDNKSKVSVSASGSATEEVQYITVDGVEKKLAGGGGGGGVTDVKVDGNSVVSGGVANINGMEKTDNRVSSFQTTPDNTHYPTEKLVKDSLDAIKFQVSVIGTKLKIVATSCYVDGNKLVIGGIA